MRDKPGQMSRMSRLSRFNLPRRFRSAEASKRPFPFVGAEAEICMSDMHPINGRTFKRQGQTYRRIGIVPHICRDGREIELAIYESGCADCGRTFTCKNVRQVRARSLNRRCDEHHRPGLHVSRVESRRAAASKAGQVAQPSSSPVSAEQMAEYEAAGLFG